ncbi:hypothetical protein L227DRAFT_511213 [Lentinus tigrinus ALCF2SS1-6]|uniref:Uncharacterized protein n=1 Tax=Lentinus tigrinus ALCF2SS1-6 TaxID=1328759 RepID=A0A5C2RUR1_9APHY|nr:hypothetical protein L227DRAFT_511213 [Lentinus tigrinus ALCF2SS1-6]
MDSVTAEALCKWKDYRYQPTDLPFVSAVHSLLGKEELIEARLSGTRPSDWVICKRGTSTPANFVYAGVFADADPYETGNFVWSEEPLPANLDESRVARHAGVRAAYTYSIDTFHEKEVWDLQATLDAYMESVKGFNLRRAPRRKWQDGSSWHLRYYFRTPMFLTCESRAGHPPAPSGLHEWVIAEHKRNKNYRANPVRPEVCGLENGHMRKIADCTPNVLEYGDVINLIFTLVYVEDRDGWGPVPFVSHVIRVQHANRVAFRLTSDLVAAERPADEGALVIGSLVDGGYPGWHIVLW